MEKIKAVEVMETWHGEIFSGQRTLLVRFKECNLMCSFCDTKTKMKNYCEGEYTIKDIQDKIDSHHNMGLLITGGEPTYRQNFNYSTLLLESIECSLKVVETNGYGLMALYESVNVPDVKYVFSPKFYINTDMWDEVKKLYDFSDQIGDDLYVKIVYNDYSNLYLNYIFQYSKDHGIQIPENIYIMPEGKTRDEVLQSAKKAFELANEYRINITTRLHLIHDFY